MSLFIVFILFFKPLVAQNLALIPKSFVSLGEKKPVYGIVVEKLNHKLSVFSIDDNGNHVIVQTYHAVTGKDPNDKMTTGDLRTPEGVYFVTQKLQGNHLPKQYGKFAFTLDYPNIFDRRQSKSGYGIWIHSTDDPGRLVNPFDTRGCVTLSNADIVDLDKYISPFETPVVITKSMEYVLPTDLTHSKHSALEKIQSWRKAWEQSDLNAYIGHYSQRFLSNGKNRNGWFNYKNVLSRNRGGKIQVTIDNPLILSFKDQLLAVFNQSYHSEDYKDYGKKFLYLQKEGNDYSIIAEKWYPVKKSDPAYAHFPTLNRNIIRNNE